MPARPIRLSETDWTADNHGGAFRWLDEDGASAVRVHTGGAVFDGPSRPWIGVEAGAGPLAGLAVGGLILDDRADALSGPALELASAGPVASGFMSAPLTASQLPPDAGPDVIDGGPTSEELAGGGGADVINGGGGNDILYGYGTSDANSGAIIATRLATGLQSPVYLTSPVGDAAHLFVVEQHTGRIMVMDATTGAVSATPFLDIPNNQLAGGSEQGLLGMAFDPDYQTNGLYYVYLTNAAGDIEVRQYTRSAGDPLVSGASYTLVLTFDHPPATNHNGGWLGFGPDGMLCIATGDGGGSGDPNNNAQNLDSWLGKILRIDVHGGDDFPADPNRNYAIPDDNPFVGQSGLDEVWAYGLRNPWRCSFDPVTGDFYIADVGQGAREEVNVVPYGTPGGINFGWHVMEGDLPYDTNDPGNPPANDPSLWDPILVYGHDSETGGFAITGGYAYYGPGGAQGVYFFADYVSGHLWTASVNENGELVDFTLRDDQIQANFGVVDQISSFGTDAAGRLYAVGLDGEIFLLTPSIGTTDAADTLSGGEGNDRIYGEWGDDIIHGDAGNDVAFGGLGDDLMYGGDGRDVFHADEGDDQLFGEEGDDELRGSNGDDYIDGGAGQDTAEYENESAEGVVVDLRLTGPQNTIAAGFDTLVSIENVKGGQANDVIHGDALNNTIWGNAGADQLFGEAGNDTLIGGAGADAMNGGAGLDYASYSTAGSEGVTLNFTTGIQLGDAAGDTFVGIERFRLSNYADTFVGAAGTQTVFGFTGNDTLSGAADADKLFGQAGNDTLNGDFGNDILVGGAGADAFNGGADRDTASYEDAIAAVTLNLVGADTGDAVGDTFNSIEVFWLSAFNDSFTGDGGDNEVRGYLGSDTLNGGGGSDRLRGEQDNDVLNGDDGDDFLWGDAGADTLNGGNGTDTACYTYSKTGLTINLATGVNTGEAAGDTYVSVERFQLTNQSTQADFFTGTTGDDWVAGYKGVDTINGGDGNDTINGGGQNDILNGGAGDDRIVGDVGDDTMTGGTGADWFRAIAFGFGHDTVNDFENGVDKLRFTGMAGVDSFSDFTITTNGQGWAVVTLTSDGSSIVLIGVTAAQVDASDFLFT